MTSVFLVDLEYEKLVLRKTIFSYILYSCLLLRVTPTCCFIFHNVINQVTKAPKIGDVGLRFDRFFVNDHPTSSYDMPDISKDFDLGSNRVDRLCICISSQYLLGFFVFFLYQLTQPIFFIFIRIITSSVILSL